jgi:hypothetical protein
MLSGLMRKENVSFYSRREFQDDFTGSENGFIRLNCWSLARAAVRLTSAMSQQRKWPRSFDHLVGARNQRWWEAEVERLGGFQVDDQCNFRRLLGSSPGAAPFRICLT